MDLDGNFFAKKAIKKLISETNAKYTLFSYSSCGRVTIKELQELFQENSKIINIFAYEHKKKCDVRNDLD